MSKDKNLIEKIHEYSLEEIMGERFGKYSKYIIQDRALPDARDGLKPVQRRILYSMYKEKNTYDKETKKSAKTVGDVMGKYHPHGDSSIYDAMVRMSQKWKQRHTLIDMQGNNGSIDGDPAAAMRYTEARLSKISGVLLQDIEKNCVLMAPTFDDTSLEPTVFPAHFPNLLVNGSTGISAGYATNIPPHNLGEIIDATIKRIDAPNCRMDTILEIVKGPDFPTGGIVEGKEGIIEAYTTGKGKVTVRSKYEFVKEKDKEKIVITEIPYDVLKSSIIKKTEEIRIDKKIDGMIEVRDESDKNDDLKIVIDLKKDANKELIINYLLKNTELKINYAFNMVAIVNRRPKVLGLLELIDAFVAHKKEVVTLRTKFDLEASLHSMHIVEGFIRALDILDEIVALIRKSKNKADAIENLMSVFAFSKIQSEAIVNMQLYKLTNTDVTLLKEEYERLKALIARLKEILESEEELKGVMKDELREIRKEYATPRITEIKEEVTEIKIEETDMVSKEDYIVCISKSGYIKKVSIKSYNASNEEETTLKEGDYLEGLYKVNNLDTILIFTNMGNYLYLPVYQIEEFKYKDLGYHVSNIVAISDGEKVVKSIAVNKFDDTYVTAFTKLGMVKRMLLESFQVTRYSKPISMFKLKENDEVVNVSIVNSNNTIIITKNGYALKFNTEEIPVVGLKTSGVKAMKLGEDDEIINAYVYGETKEHLTIFTDKNTSKRIKLDDIPLISRAKKGVFVIKSPKSKTYKIMNVFCSNSKTTFGYITDKTNILKSSEINIMDRNSVGGVITKSDINSVFVAVKLKTFDKEDLSKEEIKDEEVKEEKPKEKVVENLTMSDFFDEFKI